MGNYAGPIVLHGYELTTGCQIYLERRHASRSHEFWEWQQHFVELDDAFVSGKTAILVVRRHNNGSPRVCRHESRRTGDSGQRQGICATSHFTRTGR